MYNAKHVFIFTLLLAVPLLLLHSCTAESITGENPPDDTDSLDFPVTFGGSGEDRGKSLLQTPDNGFLVLGTTTSSDGDFDNIAPGNRDTYLIKTNSDGELSWIQTYGGSNSDWGGELIETSDGGYVVVGYTRSSDGFSPVPNRGGNDIFILKTDRFGNLIWSQTFGGSGEDLALDVAEALNGDLLITGWTRSVDGLFAGLNDGSSSAFILRLNSSGAFRWVNTYGGSQNEEAYSISNAPDGNFVITGFTNSNDGDFAGLANGGSDIYVIKVNSLGNLLWSNTYGGTAADRARDIEVTNNGEFVLTGSTFSINGDFSENNRRGFDIFVIRIDAGGQIQWTQVAGGIEDEYGYSITEVSNNGFVITGEARSNDRDFDGINYSYVSSYLMRLNNNGKIQWIRTYGGSGTDTGNSVIYTNNNFIAFTGYTFSSDGDFEGDISNSMDIFLLKTDSDGNIE